MVLSAHRFPSVYEDLDLNLSQLGCIMLDTQPGSIKVGDELAQLGAEPYTSPDPDKFWIKGVVGDDTAHVTLLYGLLESGPDWRQYVDTVLDGWTPEPVVVEDVGYFGSPYPDERYWCIIARLRLTENLLEANGRLRFLPHVDTFTMYRPHVTLAYIRGDETERDRVIAALNNALAGSELPVSPELNYGGNH